jgi:hypothetical protein
MFPSYKKELNPIEDITNQTIRPSSPSSYPNAYNAFSNIYSYSLRYTGTSAILSTGTPSYATDSAVSKSIHGNRDEGLQRIVSSLTGTATSGTESQPRSTQPSQPFLLSPSNPTSRIGPQSEQTYKTLWQT